MTKQEHVDRHKQLHAALDELVADMIEHAAMLPSKTSVLDLICWSDQQCDEHTIHEIKGH